MLALNHMHELQRVHRDLKLENILVQVTKDKFVVKLADFGFSCSSEQIDNEI
jgi:serine/threonine protein kinase